MVHLGRPRLPDPLVASKYPKSYPWSPRARAVHVEHSGKRPKDGWGLAIEHLYPRELLVAELLDGTEVAEIAGGRTAYRASHGGRCHPRRGPTAFDPRKSTLPWDECLRSVAAVPQKALGPLGGALASPLMRPDDFFEDEVDVIFGSSVRRRRFRQGLARSLRGGPIEGTPDVEAAVALARLVHDDLEAYGTNGGEVLSEAEMREALLGLRAVVERLGIEGFNPPFRDYTTSRSYWLREGAYGSWQGRRDLLAGFFDELHNELMDLETKALTSSLAEPVSPRGRTGWLRVDSEIAELRRHFQLARSPQDYRNVGNDCVIVTEALSRTVYEADRHLRPGETEPPIHSTKQRLERFVEDSLPGSANSALRRLARATIEMAQSVKHQTAPTRQEAGVAADAVILLANLLRRIH